MQAMKNLFTKYIYYFILLIIIIYLLSIFATNLAGRVWVNYDIYSDAILAKYMWQVKSLFPDGWHFGNQIYTVATPAVASLIYGIVQDAYFALAIASCLMTLGILLSYIWCLKPFVSAKSIIISLLVVIGGTNISFTAHSDWNGFQVFYTMASYYACYVIGIFITLGCFFRLLNHTKPPILIQFFILIYNFALGMQSLRELLVLNLPLCALIILNIILHHQNLKSELVARKNCYIFSLLALITNISGIFVTKTLIKNNVINQTTILSSASSNIWYNFKISMRAAWNYIGLCEPTTSIELFKLIVALFSIIIIFLSLICVFITLLNKKDFSVPEYLIIFFVISLLAVFCSGLFIIELRTIYFFCWYFLVATSVTLLMEFNTKTKAKWLQLSKYILSICLIIVSIFNYQLTFIQSFKQLPDDNNLYRELVTLLETDNIEYMYSDWRTGRNQLSAMSYDNIQYGTLEFSGNPDDLWVNLNRLYHEDWFKPENFEHAYIVLSDYALWCLEAEFSEEYRTTFLANLEYVYSFTTYDETLNFYKGSEKMYKDILQ